MTALLSAHEIVAGYGNVEIVHGVSLEVAGGGITALVGGNGAGKTTLMRALAGILPLKRGSVSFEQRGIGALRAHARVEAGIVLAPEGRLIFPHMSVEENLRIGAINRRARAGAAAAMEEVDVLFPRLAERRRQSGGTLSGGEQQMLALGRALMLAPKILVVDEPSVGLAPILVSRTIDKIKELKDRYQLTVLMAEQNFTQALRIADRGYVIVHGKIAVGGKSADEINNKALIRKFNLGL